MRIYTFLKQNYKIFSVSLFLLVISVFFYAYHCFYVSRPKVLSAAKESTVSPSTFADLSKKLYGRPKKLIFVEDKVITVVPVGVAEDDTMMTPKEWSDAGWYIHSAKAGAVGNVIINGHYDDNLGRPAAFWQLKNLRIGDKLTLVDEFGRFFRYSVTETYYVDISSSDRFKVFYSEENKAIMTLITCGGIWLPQESTYNKRLIVRTELVD